MENLEAPNTFLPEEFHRAHHLCFVNHDILAELLRSGEAHGSFAERFTFRDGADRLAFEQSADVFEWFERTARTQERNSFLRRTVFPALLSDFLHFIFECLDTSRKAKLSVSYSLLRKPIQENLFLLEVIATDLDLFASHLVANPLALRAQKAGGLDAHQRRIEKALDVLGDADLFDAGYLAQLRYGRSVEDCFDPSCNKATHLFTEHPALRTEPLNINFIFSGLESKMSQWSYLYSRLPYLLFYTRRIVEHICARFAQTDPQYVAEMERRVMAETLLWSHTIADPYREPRAPIMLTSE
jgi:hypothetical protein